MNMEQMGYILEIAKCRSINKAAKALYISQPSLSSMLRNIESEVGYKIFERTSTGIIPTPMGTAFLESAEKMSVEYSKMKLNPVPTLKDNSLSVSSAYSSMLSHLFFTFKRENPLHHATIDIFSEATIYQNMQNVKFNLTRLHIGYFFKSEQTRYQNYTAKNNLETHVLKDKMPILLVMSNDHPLASGDAVDYHEIYKHPIVTYGNLDHEDNPSVIGLDDDMDIQIIDNRATYYDAIRIGGYISMSLQFAPGEDERMGCVCKPIRNLDDYYVAAYFCQAGYSLSEREKALIDYICEKLDLYLG